MTPHRIRRAPHLFFYLHDGHFLDIEALLRGEARLSPRQELYAISLFDGEEHPMTVAEMNVLAGIPSDRWVPVSRDAAAWEDRTDLLRDFTQAGIVLCDAPGEPFETFRRREEGLSSADWNVYAALYHAMKKWRDVDVDATRPRVASLRQMADRFENQHGDLPAHFHSVPGNLGTHLLPASHKRGDLYRTLLARKTTRGFDRDAPLDLDSLTTILYYVFGCQGYTGAAGGMWLLKKTSPSGGSLHPIEVYPLIRNVEGIEPGLYHYSVERHALETLTVHTEEEAAASARLFAAGQAYAGDAQALLVVTARFPRSFWKYRTHEKAYSVILLDAGHLSQTFYLVCADLNLGAFVTAAVNDVNIEDALGLDGFSEGALAVMGVGQPARENSRQDPVFRAYIPEGMR